MTATAPLHNCSQCHQPFTEADIPVKEGDLLVTPCFHIFDQACLRGWVQSSIKNCPNCKEVCYQHEAGKDFTVIRTIFLKALRLHPQAVLTTLHHSSHQNGKCTPCQEEHPEPLLIFNQSNQTFLHQECRPKSGTFTTLTLDEISETAKEWKKTEPELQQLFVPTPPSFYQRMRRDHPHVLRAFIGISISCVAFLINHLRYHGQNKLLFILGLPILAAIKIVQWSGRLILKLLNA